MITGAPSAPKSRFSARRIALLAGVACARERIDLRSHAALAAPLRSAVERIFYDRVAAAGIAGSIDFAAASRFDVAPLDKLRAKIGLAV